MTGVLRVTHGVVHLFFDFISQICNFSSLVGFLLSSALPFGKC